MAGTVRMMVQLVNRLTDREETDALGRRLRAVDKQTRPTVQMKTK